MKKYLLLVMAVIAIGCLTLSCSSSDEEDSEDVKVLVNMLPEPISIILTEEQRVFVNDNNQFTLNFLKTVNETDQSGKSFIYSPLSITYVLGMVNDAAIGLTEQELEQTLGFHQGGIQAVNDYCKKLIEGLPKVDKEVSLNIANAIFLNNKYTLKPQFQQDMLTYYDAKAEALDFSSSLSLDRINDWCDDKTNGMIPSILDEINPNMVTYLLNAIYFKANWANKFDKKNTKNETFTTDGGSTTLPMMHQNVLIQYVKNETYSAIKIPYGNSYWNMTVMLPEKGKTTDDIIEHLAIIGFNDVEHWYCATMGDEPVNIYRNYNVDLKLPRFETSSDTDDITGSLIGLLQKMGIYRAFDWNCTEIPNMCDRPVFISMMRQKAKINVNEEGSEAAAVTVAGMEMNSVNPTTIEFPKATFHANRPFVYVIRESSSGVILFVGKFTGQ